MATAEYHFQHEIVQRFSDTYPELQGCLVEINNDAKGGIKKIMHRIAMGMCPGASDLFLFANGVFTAIECKAEGYRHKKSHIEKQKRWGRNVVLNKGNYIMSYCADEIFDFIEKALSEERGMFKSCY